MKICIPIVIYCLSVFADSLFSQTGNPFITNYSSKTFGGSDQNFSIAQDSTGKLFVANRNGIYLFDGKYWKLISLTKNSVSSKSVFRSNSGVIYVGCEKEFGYLEQNTKGKYIYKSLMHLLDQKSKDAFQIIWSIKEIKNKIYFCSNEAVFCYSGNSIKTYYPEKEGFHTFFDLDDQFIVREWGIGLKIMMNNELHFIQGSEVLKDIKVYSILKKTGSKFIMATRNGLYILDLPKNNPGYCRIKKTENRLDEWFISNDVYCGEKLGPNKFVFGSIKKGLLFTDSSLNITSTINTNQGLLDDNVKCLFSDYNNNLWIGLNSGVSMCEVNSPITFWNKQDGINGVIEASAKFNNKLFAATDKGLIGLNNVTKKFEKTELNEQVFDLKKVNGLLFIGAKTGLYSLDNSFKLQSLYNETVYALFADSLNHKLYLSSDDAVLCCAIINRKLNLIKTYPIPGITRSLTMNKEGFIVAGNETEGIVVIDPKQNSNLLTVRNGLPTNNSNYVLNVNNKIVIATDTGFYEWNFKNPAIVIRSNEFNVIGRKSAIVNAKQIGQSIWFTESNLVNEIPVEKINKITFDGKDYKENTGYLKRLAGIGAKSFFHDSGLVYISTNQGLFCCNETGSGLKSQFATIINKLSFGTDTFYRLENYSKNNYRFPSELAYTYNQLHITPTATSFYENGKLEFSYYLEGRETKFSDWKKNESIDYTDLREGTYTFHLKAKDSLGNISEPISVSFTILPPWYRSLWAYVIYVISGTVIFIFSLRFYNKRLIDANLKLEGTIQERTKTIVSQKQELEHKNQEITDSINYAKRIQLAILPEIKAITTQWEKLFIFYQPKDIVSGDFFWYKKINEHEFLIAAADCTGHGVPGGFMSMICSDKLHQAAEQSLQPNEILFKANNYIKDALKQGNIEGGTKDGMEIALLRINTQTKQISYSGANRFLWIVKKGALEITEIKPTKASIASTTDYNNEYALHALHLEAGDRLYMSTDGFPDQFGGRDEKKYMTKNFKQFLLNNTSKAIKEQHDLVRREINDWMKGTAQVDDLLVIGIEL